MKRFTHRAAWVSVGLGVCLQVCTAWAGEVEDVAREWLVRCAILDGGGALTVGDAVPIEGLGSGFQAFAVGLVPRGYLVVVPEQSQRPIVAFSSGSNLDLRQVPDNGFWKALRRHSLHAASLGDAGGEQVTGGGASVTTEYVAPLLETQWAQWRHYNSDCPEYPSVPSSYDGRVPAGCVPVAYAQAVRFHAWPPAGAGQVTYVDDTGSVTGAHQAVFSNPYAWENMRYSYNLYQDEPVQLVDAVAELIYEMGVLLEVDYEGGETVSRMSDGATRLHDYLFYEEGRILGGGAELVAGLKQGLMDGCPGLLSLPPEGELAGHVTVVDGHYLQDGVSYFHVNYGWGGINDGWYTVDDLMGRIVDFGLVGFRPQLLAFPASSTVSWQSDRTLGGSWWLPRTAIDEAEAIHLYEVAATNGLWVHGADTFEGVDREQVGVKDWVVETNDDRTVFFKRAGGYADTDYALTVEAWFTPGTNSALELVHRYVLGEDQYWVAVTTNGADFVRIWEVSSGSESWGDALLPLGAFSGVPIQLRIGYSSGSYLLNGGIWIDRISLHGASYEAAHWLGLASNLTASSFAVETNRSYDTSGFTDFVPVAVWDYKDWALATDEGAPIFRKVAGGYATISYDLASADELLVQSSTYLEITYRATLGADRFEVWLVDDDGDYTFCWNAPNADRWHTEYVPLGAVAGEEATVLLRYVVDSFFEAGGVWIKDVSLVQVPSMPCRDRPMLTGSLPPLPVGAIRVITRVASSSGLGPLSPPFELRVSGPADDGDGMPEAWELLHGLDIFSDDAGADPDGDGLSNVGEFVAGTDPLHAGSALTLAWDTPGLAIHGVTGRTYWIESKASLLSPRWESCGESVVGTNGPILMPSAVVGDTRFYRARVVFGGEGEADQATVAPSLTVE